MDDADVDHLEAIALGIPFAPADVRDANAADQLARLRAAVIRLAAEVRRERGTSPPPVPPAWWDRPEST